MKQKRLSKTELRRINDKISPYSSKITHLHHIIGDIKQKKGYAKQSLFYKIPKLPEDIRGEFKRIAEIDTITTDLTRYQYSQMQKARIKDLLLDLNREKKTILEPYVETTIRAERYTPDKKTFDIGSVFDTIMYNYEQDKSNLRPDDAADLIMDAGGNWIGYEAMSKKIIPVTVDLNILRKKARYVSPFKITSTKEKEIRELIHLIKDNELKK